MPTSGIVAIQDVNIPGAVVVDEWCEVAGAECCESQEICGTALRSGCFVSFSGLKAPNLGYYTEFEETLSPGQFILQELSAAKNQSYRMRAVGPASVDPSETPSPILYILADSEVVGAGTYSEDFAVGPSVSHTSPDTRIYGPSDEMVALGSASVYSDLAGNSLTNLPRPILLSPTPYQFTVPCDATCLSMQADLVLLPIWGVPGDLADCKSDPTAGWCRACQDVSMSGTPYSTPNPGTKTDTNTFAETQSSGPLARLKVYKQIYLLFGCVDDVPYVKVQFDTYLVLYERGKWSHNNTVDIFELSNNRVTIGRHRNILSQGNPTGTNAWSGNLPDVAWVDSVHEYMVTISP